MKRLLRVLIILFLLFLVACESEVQAPEPATRTDAPTDTLRLGTEDHPSDTVFVTTCFTESRPEEETERRLCYREAMKVEGPLLVLPPDTE